MYFFIQLPALLEVLSNRILHADIYCTLTNILISISVNSDLTLISLVISATWYMRCIISMGWVFNSYCQYWMWSFSQMSTNITIRRHVNSNNGPDPDMDALIRIFSFGPRTQNGFLRHRMFRDAWSYQFFSIQRPTLPCRLQFKLHPSFFSVAFSMSVNDYN